MLFKDKKKKLLVGIDLGNRYSQISFVYTDRDEPMTVSYVAGQEQYNVPTVLCKRQEVNQWYYGKEALKYIKEEEGILVKNLLKNACEGKETVIEEQHFSPIELLALFVRRLLSMLNALTDNEKPDVLMITVENLDKRMIEVLTELSGKIGMDGGQVFFQSHVESFYQYMIHQTEDLWHQQVVVCDFSDVCMKTYRLELNRRTTPVVAFVEEKIYMDMPYKRMPSEEPMKTQACEQLDAKFTEIVKGVLEGRVVSSCYLIGEGFLGNWCKESLKIICRSRRVFQGNNLYSKGACYALQEKYNKTELSDKYVFLAKDTIKANVGMYVGTSSNRVYYPIMDAGINWYDAKRDWDILLEDENELRFVITPLNKKNKREFVIKLEGLPAREDAFSRIGMSISFESENKFSIKAMDLGFGEFFVSNGKEWKEEVNWEE